MDIPAIMPTVDLEINAFQAFFDANDFMWPNLDIDLALDQGWTVYYIGLVGQHCLEMSIMDNALYGNNICRMGFYVSSSN